MQHCYKKDRIIREQMKEWGWDRIEILPHEEFGYIVRAWNLPTSRDCSNWTYEGLYHHILMPTFVAPFLGYGEDNSTFHLNSF